MSILLAPGAESTTLFTITVQQSGRRPSARFAGQRRITVPLNRLQATLRRLRPNGDILSVARCQNMGDQPGFLNPVPGTASDEHSAAEPPSASEKAEGPDSKEVLTQSLVDLAVESWRFAWRFARLLQRLNAGRASRYGGQLHGFREKLKEALRNAGMEIVNVEGRLFNSGIKATPLNREDFGADDTLVVDRMTEPIIKGQNGVMHEGTVMLKAAVAPSVAAPAEETARAAPTEPISDPKEILTKLLVDLAVESWRFSKLFGHLLQKLAAGERGRYRGQLSWFQEKLSGALGNAGMRIVNVEGHPFDPGVAATPLNAGDFGADDALIMDRMLEPIVMGSDGLVRMGTVTLKKVKS